MERGVVEIYSKHEGRRYGVKTYLITGGAGFIGSNFINYMMNKYPDIKIVNVDSLTYAGNLENLKWAENNKNYTFIQADISDRNVVNTIFSQTEINYVINFAAESHVDRSITGPEIFVTTNVMGTQNLLSAAKDKWLCGEDVYTNGCRFLQISTDEVYGSLGETGFFTEQTPLDPHSPYSASKASADLLVKAYFDTFKFPALTTRCSNNYGPYQFPEKLIPLVINNLLQHKSVPIYGDGLQVRDWLHVNDHCRAIDMVLHGGKAGEVYNIGGHNERTNIYIVKRIIKYIYENVDQAVTENLITHVKDRKGHDRRYGIDPEKIKNDLGWQPEITFEQGIEQTIGWYLDNKQWMDNVTSGEYRNYYENMYTR